MNLKNFLFVICLFWLHFAFAQPTVIVIGSENPKAVKKQITHYLHLLEIRGNLWLSVNFTRNIPKDVEGMTICKTYSRPQSYQIIRVRIDARLEEAQRVLVLAHEMIHVKQFAKGDLRMVSNQGVMWKGKFYRQKAYSDRTPWEREAFANDRRLEKEYRSKTVMELTILD